MAAGCAAVIEVPSVVELHDALGATIRPPLGGLAVADLAAAMAAADRPSR